MFCFVFCQSIWLFFLIFAAMGMKGISWFIEFSNGLGFSALYTDISLRSEDYFDPPSMSPSSWIPLISTLVFVKLWSCVVASIFFEFLWSLSSIICYILNEFVLIPYRIRLLYGLIKTPSYFWRIFFIFSWNFSRCYQFLYERMVWRSRSKSVFKSLSVSELITSRFWKDCSHRSSSSNKIDFKISNPFLIYKSPEMSKSWSSLAFAFLK